MIIKLKAKNISLEYNDAKWDKPVSDIVDLVVGLSTQLSVADMDMEEQKKAKSSL